MPGASQARGFLARPAAPVSADGATIACLFAVAILVIPARVVLRGIPLSLSPAELLGLAMGLWWMSAQLTSTLGAAKGRSPVRTAAFGYAAVLVLSYGAATYRYLPDDELSSADHAMVLAIAYFGVLLLVCDGVRGKERLDVVLKTVVVSGAVVATIGALQFVFDLDLTDYLIFPGLRFSSEYDFVLERESFRRVAATLGHPIEFGVVCSMILPLAIHYGFASRRRGERASPWWICSALLVLGLLFSVSRSAMLGLLGVGFVLLLGWSGRRRLRAILIAAGFLIAVWVLVPGLLRTFVDLFANLGVDDSIRWRTHDYAAAGAEISMHPWLGRGLGTWYAPKHMVFDNQYLHTLVETGVLGLVAFVATFVTGCYVGARVRLRSVDWEARDLGLSLTAALVVPLIGSATFDLMSFHAAVGLSFLLLGAAGSLMRSAVLPVSSRPGLRLRDDPSPVTADARSGEHTHHGQLDTSVQQPRSQE